MSVLSLFPKPHPISRTEAFHDQGVILAFPARSWSGQRAEDRSIVIAMREADIHEHADGYRCLLWSPVFSQNAEWLDRPSRVERLQHCRLAALHGSARALITRGAAAVVERDVVVRVRVVAQGDDYWALWGRLPLAPRAPLSPPARRAMCSAVACA